MEALLEIAKAEAELNGTAVSEAPVLSDAETALAKQAFGKGWFGSENICQDALSKASKDTLLKLAQIARNGIEKAKKLADATDNPAVKKAAETAMKTQTNRLRAILKALGAL